MSSILALGQILTGICAAQPMDLEQAFDRLESGNRGLQAGREKIMGAQASRRASWGAFMPVVKLQADVVRLDRDIVMDLDPIREGIMQLEANNAVQLQNLSYAMKNGGAQMPAQQQAAVQQAAYRQLDAGLPHFQETMKTRDDWGVSVVAYQPLFHGGRIWAANRVATAREDAAESDLLRQKGDLRRDFARLWVQGVLLKQSIGLRQQALESIGRHRDRARRMVEQGVADKAAFLRAGMAFAEARTALSDDSSRLESVGLTLAQMAGSAEPILPSDSLRPPPAAPGSPEELQASVERRSPLLRSLADQREVAHRAVAVKNADFLPEIGLFGKYEFNREAARDALEPIWMVGVKGEMTLFRGGADWNSRAAALAAEREVDAMRGEARSVLEAQTARQILSMKQAGVRWENLSAQAELARENHRVTEARFAEGQATGLEVVDAWLSSEKAELERLSAAGDGWIALDEILWATGRTDEFRQIWKGGVK